MLGVCLLAYHQSYSSENEVLNLEPDENSPDIEISIEHENNIAQIKPIEPSENPSTKKSTTEITPIQPIQRSKCVKNCPNGSCIFRFEENGIEMEECECDRGFEMDEETQTCKPFCDLPCVNGKCKIIYDWVGNPAGIVLYRIGFL